MGTSNFHNVNAYHTYVIDYGDDEYLWNESQELISDNVKSIDGSFETHTKIKSKEELSSFPSSSIGFWCDDLTYLGIEFEVHVNLFLRNGYYEAANLDYEIEWYTNGNDIEYNVEDTINTLDQYTDYYDVNRGLWIIHKDSLEIKLNEIEDELIEKVEHILTEISTPYNVVASFSNGETIYEKENNESN